MENDKRIDEARERLFFTELSEEEIEFEQKLARNYYLNRCIPSPNYSKTLKESVPISYGWPSDQDEQIKLINGDNLLPIQVLKPIPPKAEGLKFTEVSTENLLHDRLLFKSLLQLKNSQ